jgi:hypothetical protein
MTDRPYCYLWVECHGKSFPFHIVSNKKGLIFEYGINFVNLDQLKNFQPENCDASMKEIPKLTNKTSCVHMTSNEIRYLCKRVKFCNFERPTLENNDHYTYGDIVHVGLPTKWIEAKTPIQFVVVFIRSPKLVRSSFAISFTTEKYLAIKDRLTSDPFGAAIKQKLFGKGSDAWDIADAVKKLKRDRY